MELRGNGPLKWSPDKGGAFACQSRGWSADDLGGCRPRRVSSTNGCGCEHPDPTFAVTVTRFDNPKSGSIRRALAALDPDFDDREPRTWQNESSPSRLRPLGSIVAAIADTPVLATGGTFVGL